MKVVLDTNIWVSAIIWGGIPDQILLLREQQKITIAMSQELLDELESTFNKRKLIPKLQALSLTVPTIINLIQESVIFYPIQKLNVRELRDADDNIILATAIAAESDVIITGDQDLLILFEYQGIAIRTAKDFLNEYQLEIVHDESGIDSEPIYDGYLEEIGIANKLNSVELEEEIQMTNKVKINFDNVKIISSTHVEEEIKENIKYTNRII